MQIKNFNFNLPENLIAQNPITQRDHSKLMIVNRFNNSILHKNFYDITSYICEGDCIVLNDSRVIKARLFAHKNSKKFEIFLLKMVSNNIWECLIKPFKKIFNSDILILNDNINIMIIEKINFGICKIQINVKGDKKFKNELNNIGNLPLPPYIKKKLYNDERYQTIYSNKSKEGSVASPTAGLHFTNELINELKNKNINIAYITLHVGLGTFKPINVQNIIDHKMHYEEFSIDSENAQIINNSINNNKKIFAVGTTTARALESIFLKYKSIKPCNGNTNIFIYPGYKFNVIDSLITNFHLPKSTLLMLVSAFYNRKKIIQLYRLAILNKYRFFSFGDSMLII